MAESQSWGAGGDSFLSWAVWLLPPLLAGPAHSSWLQPPEPQPRVLRSPGGTSSLAPGAPGTQHTDLLPPKCL